MARNGVCCPSVARRLYLLAGWALVLGCTPSATEPATRKTYRLSFLALHIGDPLSPAYSCAVSIQFQAEEPLSNVTDAATVARVRRQIQLPGNTRVADLEPNVRLSLSQTGGGTIGVELRGGLTRSFTGQRAAIDGFEAYEGQWTCDDSWPLADDPSLLESGYPAGASIPGRWTIARDVTVD